MRARGRARSRPGTRSNPPHRHADDPAQGRPRLGYPTRNSLRIAPNSTPKCPNPESHPDRPWTTRTSTPSRPLIAPGWTPGRPRVNLESTRNKTQIDPRSPRHGPRVGSDSTPDSWWRRPRRGRLWLRDPAHPKAAERFLDALPEQPPTTTPASSEVVQQLQKSCRGAVRHLLRELRHGPNSEESGCFASWPGQAGPKLAAKV